VARSIAYVNVLPVMVIGGSRLAHLQRIENPVHLVIVNIGGRQGGNYKDERLENSQDEEEKYSVSWRKLLACP